MAGIQNPGPYTFQEGIEHRQLNFSAFCMCFLMSWISFHKHDRVNWIYVTICVTVKKKFSWNIFYTPGKALALIWVFILLVAYILLTVPCLWNKIIDIRKYIQKITKRKVHTPFIPDIFEDQDYDYPLRVSKSTLKWTGPVEILPKYQLESNLLFTLDFFSWLLTLVSWLFYPWPLPESASVNNSQPHSSRVSQSQHEKSKWTPVACYLLALDFWLFLHDFDFWLLISKSWFLTFDCRHKRLWFFFKFCTFYFWILTLDSWLLTMDSWLLTIDS